MMDLYENVIGIISRICKTEEVYRRPDLDLFDSGLLDSFGIIELLLALETECQIHVPITEFDRTEWYTPNRIVSNLEAYV